MRSRVVSVMVAAAFAILASGCASTTSRSAPDSRPSGGAPEAAAPEAHDMAGMAGHDMNALSAHEKAQLAFLFPDGDDRGWSKVENGMQHDMTPEVPLAKLPPATRVELLRQLSLTMDVIRKFPTVKEAEAAGYRRAGPFIPGLGTHYVSSRMPRGGGALTDADILNPATIIYDGLKPESPIAGFMYMAVSMTGPGKEPEGFAGPNDHWHFHTGICLSPGSNGVLEALGFDGSITEAACRAKGGSYVAATQYLLHVWTVPGYSSPLGVFSHTNPALTCPDGTYYTDDHDITNKCKSSQ